MKVKTKKTTWVFLYIKYSKFRSVLLEHFVERKPLIYEVWHTVHLHCYSFSVPLEGNDVVIGPFQGHGHVQKAVISRCMMVSSR